MLQYVLTSETLNVYDGPNFVEVGRDHPNFPKIASLLADPNSSFDDVKELACIVSAISSASNGKIEVTDMGVFYNGELIHNAVVDAIFDYRKMKLPLDPIIKFLENLMQNSSKNSIDQLWRFIEHHKLPLTEDGYLLAYKAVRSNYLDKYSGKIDNSIGKVVKMDRNKISDDANYHCAQGLHVGGLSYSGPEGWYSSNGDICIIVKVNPRDVVCVPYDHNATKVRVCEYEVVKNYCKILKSTTYNSYYDECECDDDDDNEVWNESIEVSKGDIVTWSGGCSTYEVLTNPDEFDVVFIRDVATRKIHEANIVDLSLED